GTDLIMALSREPQYRDDPEQLASKLRGELLNVFPPALLGRIVTIPYYPLSNSMLDGIVRLQLGRIDQRIRDNHDASFVYTDAVVDHIVSRCTRPHPGGRMIDNIITNTLLPALSREFLVRSLAKEELKEAKVSAENGAFTYSWSATRSGGNGAAAPAPEVKPPAASPDPGIWADEVHEGAP